MEPLLHRLQLLLRKRALRKDAREKLEGALTAIEDLEEAIKKLMTCGKNFWRIVEEGGARVGALTADRLYAEEVNWMFAVTDLIIALRKLTRQAEAVTHFESFMNDLKHLDKPMYEMIRMLGRAYEGGKVNPSEFPTFMALYTPQKHQKELHGVIQAELVPFVDKLDDMLDAMPLPFRGRLLALKRGAEKLKETNGYITTVNEETAERMFDQSPDWLKALSRLYDKATKRGIEIAKQRAVARAPPPKKSRGGAIIWPPPKKKRS
jgi:hypothetical protein